MTDFPKRKSTVRSGELQAGYFFPATQKVTSNLSPKFGHHQSPYHAVHKSIIVAKSTNHVIGIHNTLPWHLPADLKHFKHTTLGHHVILGRKTFASLPGPLPGRKPIVLTQHPDDHIFTCHTAPNLPAAFDLAQKAGETEVFIAGGSTVYEAALATADKIYLTEVHAVVMGDTFFPTLDTTQWLEIQRVSHLPDTQHAYAYDFVQYIRVR